jgi:hypothetical protein
MNRGDERRIRYAFSLIAGGHRLIGDAADLIMDVLNSRDVVPMMRVSLVVDGVTLTNQGSLMEQTITGKNVGDAFVVKAGPAQDSRGRPVGAASDVTFEVADPNVLGLEIDPQGVTIDEGQRAARFTILEQTDSEATITLNRPKRGPLVSTIRIEGTGPETTDAAVDLPFTVEDAAGPSAAGSAGAEDAEGPRGAASAGRSGNPAPSQRSAKPGGRLTGF